MKKGLIIISFLIISTTLFAQIRDVSILNGKAIEDSLFNSNMFFLKEFADSKITMNDGTIYSAKANISSIAQAVVVIGDRGDTLGFLKESDIAIFSGGGIVASKVNGVYHQILSISKDFFLGKTRKIDLRTRRPRGAYGGSTHTSSVDELSHIAVGGAGEVMRIINEDWSRGDIIELEYEYEEELFIISNGRRYVPTKRNFEKFFSKQKNEISDYVKENKTNFSKRDDVIGLFLYLVQS